MTNATIGGRDVAVLYGDQGSDGETVLRYSAQPTVQASSAATVDHDLGRRHRRPAAELHPRRADPGRDLRRRRHARCCCCSPTRRPPRRSGGRTPAAARCSSAAPTCCAPRRRDRRHGRADRRQRHRPGHRGVHARRASVTWNGQAVTTTADDAPAGLTGTIPTAAAGHAARHQPSWKHQEESPEAQPGFDDSSWQVADKMTTNSVRRRRTARCRCCSPTTTASTPATPGTAAGSTPPATRPASTCPR